MRNFYKKFFYIPKIEKMSEKVFLTRISLSVLSMLICLVVFCAGTWAYFTATISSETTTIMSATYDLTIEHGEGVTNNGDKSFICSGNSDFIYTFTLEAIGTAENGYCVIYVDSDSNSPYYTDQINKDSTLTIQIKAADGTNIRFEPHWGTSIASASGVQTYGGNNMIVCSSAENLIETPIENDDYILHTVAEGETLAAIAEKYQIPVAAIYEYNEISEETILVVGQQIAIPKNYVIEDSSESTDEESEVIDSTEDTVADDSTETEETDESNNKDNDDASNSDDDSQDEDDSSDMTDSTETEESNDENNDDASNSDDDSQDENDSSDMTDSTETESEQGSQLGDESDLDANQKSDEPSDLVDNEATNNPEISSEEVFVDEAGPDSTGEPETDSSEV